MQEEVDKILQKFGAQMVSELKNNLISSGGVASSKTLNSIKHSVSGSKLTISANSSLSIFDKGIGSGRKVNVQKISQWILDKKISIREDRTGSGRFSRRSDRNIASVAFLIARSINRRGTIKRFAHRGADIIDNSIGIRSVVNKEMRAAVSEIARRQIKLVLKQIKKK